mmetsp:Transcript_64851/g.180242  ORF Transcript_64851/g.180242 Transcript_64851/m.180242 type:complete len:96 (-) Transcript_64851:351-638(-)
MDVCGFCLPKITWKALLTSVKVIAQLMCEAVWMIITDAKSSLFNSFINLTAPILYDTMMKKAMNTIKASTPKSTPLSVKDRIASEKKPLKVHTPH